MSELNVYEQKMLSQEFAFQNPYHGLWYFFPLFIYKLDFNMFSKYATEITFIIFKKKKVSITF